MSHKGAKDTKKAGDSQRAVSAFRNFDNGIAFGEERSLPFLSCFGWLRAGDRRDSESGQRRIQRFNWDTAGRLREVKRAADTVYSAQYTADGGRWRHSDASTGEHIESWGLFDSGLGGTYNTPGAAQRRGGAAGTDRFFHSDWLGSTRYTTDRTGTQVPNAMRFNAYGERSKTGGNEANPTEFQYAGAHGYQREAGDSLDLDYLYQRYYDPAVGRFLSRDPIRWAGGLNLYGYCGANPVGLVDPSGLAGVGHHYVVKEAWENLPFSKAVKDVFDGATTGPLAPGRAGGNLFDKAHRSYSRTVIGELERFMQWKGVTPQTMTAAQATEFVAHVKSTPNPAIRNFLMTLNPRPNLPLKSYSSFVPPPPFCRSQDTFWFRTPGRACAERRGGDYTIHSIPALGLVGG